VKTLNIKISNETVHSQSLRQSQTINLIQKVGLNTRICVFKRQFRTANNHIENVSEMQIFIAA